MGLELKKGDQIQFLIDRSGSMATADCDGETRYNHSKEKVKAFVRGASSFDPDGVSVHFFNNRVEAHKNVSTEAEVDRLIDQHKPGGGTATHLALQTAWNEHRSTGAKASFIFVITDGEPSEPADTERQIVSITQSVSSPEEFRIAFLTVGKRTPELQQWLTNLDSNLKGAKFDIVSVEELDNVDFDQAVADLIGSSTTADEAAAGHVAGKATTQI
jgi:Mg-chelatase subunit ChlD